MLSFRRIKSLVCAQSNRHSQARTQTRVALGRFTCQLTSLRAFVASQNSHLSPHTKSLDSDERTRSRVRRQTRKSHFDHDRITYKSTTMTFGQLFRFQWPAKKQSKATNEVINLQQHAHTSLMFDIDNIVSLSLARV